MESWMIGATTVVMTTVGTAYVMRYIVGELKSKIEVHDDRLERHGDDLVKLNTKSELAVTAEQVDAKYVSKELFRQFEKHIDGRFDRLENSVDKILRHIEKDK